ncbi:FKBP12-interacting protein of 37 kDa-like isoform X3 [Syzygium oleosum]|uniref:FKBP12-interacting protein of 37 kDa-like isoform X3 n=1 Tax=Syzygium oleosum TaxID=219896 RepID=UPI0024BAF3B5|nr:FKBP12-interacting protein of 37 kDa-like isoform X3 [Syzygium oleosum]
MAILTRRVVTLLMYACTALLGRHCNGNKRAFGDIEDDEDDLFGSKKGNTKAEENAPGAATGMILSLRESLQTCKDTLTTCQTELEAAKSEIQKWHSSFQNESFIPSGTSPEPKVIINYLQTLRSSEEALREQLEKAKKKEAAFIVTFAKREQEIAELKVNLLSWLWSILEWFIYPLLQSAVRDLKAQLKPPSMQARRLLLDPAIHEEFSRLKNLVEEKDKRVKELQDNIAAVSFTPQSKMGKMLMAKCRTLQEENEEIGNQAAEGKMHELAMKLALQKSQNAELLSQFEGLNVAHPVSLNLYCSFYHFFSRREPLHVNAATEGLYKHMEGLTNDVEKPNEMVLILQEKLEEKDQELRRLKNERQQKNMPDAMSNKAPIKEENQGLGD